MNSSSEFQECARAAQACENAVAKLKARVIEEQSIAAAMALRDVAVSATLALHELWFPTQKGAIAGRKIEGSGDLVARREMLNHWLGTKRPFPILHHWDRAQPAQQTEILRMQRSGPFVGRSQRASPMRWFLEKCVMPQFGEIQRGLRPSEGIDLRIWNLRPLAKITQKEWAKVIADWAVSTDLSDQNVESLRGSILWEVAKPERELRRRKLKRKRTLKRFIAGEKAAGDSGEKEPSVAATNIQVKGGRRRREIAAMKPSLADLRNGLKSEILSFFERQLSR